jgi:hypothetical protein
MNVGADSSPGPGNGRPMSIIGTSLADSKDLRWIDEYGDDLTMAIAMRDWDESLKLVERGQSYAWREISANEQATISSRPCLRIHPLNQC